MYALDKSTGMFHNSPMPDQDAAESELVQRHAKELGEHFDAVQIMCTRHDGDRGSTRIISKGCGNWHARLGMMRECLLDAESAIWHEQHPGKSCEEPP